MESYEIRLLSAEGAVVLFFANQFCGDQAAIRSLDSIESKGSARYEIWSGSRKVAEGAFDRPYTA